MQAPLRGNVYLTQSINPKSHTGGVKSFDIATSFEETTKKLKKLHKLLNRGVMDEDVTSYIPGLEDFFYQGMICITKTQRQADATYTNM